MPDLVDSRAVHYNPFRRADFHYRDGETMTPFTRCAVASFPVLCPVFLAGSAVGLLACALLAVNNLRDIAGATVSGKRTLAVRIGDRAARWLYVAFLDGALVIASLCALSRPWCLLVLGGGVVAGPAVRDVLGGAEGPRLIGVLAVTARTQLVALSLIHI